MDSPRAITKLKKAWYRRVAEPVGVVEAAGVVWLVSAGVAESVGVMENNKHITSRRWLSVEIIIS